MIFNNEEKKHLEECINKIAIEYVQAKIEEKKIALLSKLIDKLLKLVLNLKETATDLDLRRAMELEGEKEDNLIKKLRYDSLVFMQVIKYTINTYKEEKGNFINYFRLKYFRELAGSKSEMINSSRVGGIKISFNHKSIYNNINREIEKYYRENNKELVNKRLEELSDNELKSVLEFLHQEKYYEKYRSIAMEYKCMINSKSLDDKMGEDGDKEIILAERIQDNNVDIENEVLSDDSSIVDICREVLKRASNIQKKYFQCFIVAYLLKSQNIKLINELKDDLNMEYYGYILTEMKKGNIKDYKIENQTIADFLNVGKSGISKQFLNFQTVFAEEYKKHSNF